MTNKELETYLGIELVSILNNIGFEVFDYVDIVKELNEIPSNFNKESDLDFYHYEAERKGYKDITILSQEKTEETYIHFCDMIILFKDKVYLIKYSYRSDC